MTLEQLLSKMFPEDQERGFPCFLDLELSLQKWLDESTRGHLEICMSNHKAALANLTDVNDQLKLLQSERPDDTTAFVAAAIEAYFSAAQVSKLLRGGMTSLFPNGRTLAEIDHDLLEPVFLGNLGELES